MGRNARPRSVALLPLLALLLAAPAAAQEPPSTRDFYRADLVPLQGSVSIEYLDVAQIDIEVRDMSGTSVSVEGESPPRESNKILLSADVVSNNSRGWSASITPPQLQSSPGDINQATLTITAGATIQEPVVEVQVTAVYSPFGSSEDVITTTSVMAVAESFPRLSMLMDGLPDTFEPGSYQQIPIKVQNPNYYPDMISFEVEGPEGWMVSPPSSVHLAPGEERTVWVDVRAPLSPWFVYGTKSELVRIEAVSETADRPITSRAVPISHSGIEVPAWSYPHALMLLFGGVLFTKRSRRKRRDRRMEKGKPSYPGLDAEHEAELERLKITDSEEADAAEEQLTVLYKQRLRAWKEHRRERQEMDQALDDAYQRRHDVLLQARDEGPGDGSDRRRSELLERKRELLERKKRSLEPAGGGDD